MKNRNLCDRGSGGAAADQIATATPRICVQLQSVVEHAAGPVGVDDASGVVEGCRFTEPIAIQLSLILLTTSL